MKEKIAIIGGGLSGSLLAICLAKRGFTVDLFERRGDIRKGQAEAGRSINLALSTRGIDALEKVGLADKVLNDAIPMNGRMMHSTQGELTYQPYGKQGQYINSVSRSLLNIKLLELADAYEMPSDSVNGMSPEAVHEAVARAAKRAREGGGPTLLEMKTYRYKGHSMSDPQKYRSKDEVEEYKERDPIDHCKNKLVNEFSVAEEEIEQINERIRQVVEECVRFAEESPWPDDNELLKDVYQQEDYPFIVD
jgi:monoamine oxidase